MKMINRSLQKSNGRIYPEYVFKKAFQELTRKILLKERILKNKQDK